MLKLMDYSDTSEVWSFFAHQLQNSVLAEMFQKFNVTQDAIILHAGLPPSGSFPLSSVTASTAFTSPHLLNAVSQRYSHTTDSPLMQVRLAGQLMNDAQQYMFHAGHPPLLRWVRDMAASQHRPPNPVDCAMTSGAVDALTAAVNCLLNPGDYIICEEFTYPHAPQCIFKPRRLNMLPVGMDEQGMLPDRLREVLANAPPSPATGRPPSVIYLIPGGQNPTGAVMTVERKREIYQICREYNLIILEDDAYYWLQYPRGSRIPESEQPGLKLPASFLSMDTDSRVLRIDTFSKLLGPGFRLGWVTGHPRLVSKIGHAIQAGTCGPSSLSQVVVSQLLDGWGYAGFEAFIKQQQALYAKRADAVVTAARRYLDDLVGWQDPKAGMFIWFKLKRMDDVDKRLLDQLVEQRVAVVPGRPFWTDTVAQQAGKACPYFRVAFSSVPEDRIEEAFARLATAIRAAAVAVPMADSVVSEEPSLALDDGGSSDADVTTLVSDSCPSPTVMALIGGGGGGGGSSGGSFACEAAAHADGVVTLQAAADALLKVRLSTSLVGDAYKKECEDCAQAPGVYAVDGLKGDAVVA